MSAEAYLRSAAAEVGRFLEAEIPPADRSPIWAAARHCVLGAGKRLRPALCLAACEACGGTRASALPAAAALECVHAYSLVHDDLPAMDDDDVRRGRPACHIAFGIPPATRAGVALLALAFRIAGRAYADHPQGRGIVSDLTAASGADGMVGGQAMDLAGTGVAHAPAALEAIHRRKTGALLAASIVLGARVADAPAARLETLRAAGEALGLAFQIVDDILDIESSAEEMGKPVRSDASKGKVTMPAVVGAERARVRARDLLAEAEQGLAACGAAGSALSGLARFVVERRT